VAWYDGLAVVERVSQKRCTFLFKECSMADSTLVKKLAEEDKKLISKIYNNNHFNHQGNGFYFNHTVADTPDYLTLKQARLLLYYVSRLGKEVLEGFSYECRAIYWEGKTYFVPTGNLLGTFPDTKNYGMICADGGTCT
jgi:hypothetical protein